MSVGPRSAPGVRAAAACIALAFLLLFVVNTFWQSPASQARAARYFTTAQIDRGLQYSQERKLLSWCGLGLQLALLTALVCTSWSRRLADFFERWTGRRWFLTLLLMAASYFLLNEALSLPLGLASLEQARAWNMTDRAQAAWLVDWSKMLALDAVQWSVVVLGLYGLMYFFPRRWWLLAGLGGAALGVLYALVLPELIQPLFNRFWPLEDPYLRQRVQTLASRAGVPVSEVLVMDASRQGRHTNAYFVGFGPTRRVVLYDTLLQSHRTMAPESTTALVGLLAGSGSGPLAAASHLLAVQSAGEDELETILGHELGHWQNQHIVKGLLLGSVAGLAGLYILARILAWAVGRQPFCLSGPADPAGLPLIVLLCTVGSWLALPVQNSISRVFERQADAAALELARKPDAFIAAEKRLARDNLSNVAPAPFNTWMFASHPPAVERIEMAEEWKSRHPNGP